MPRWRGGNRPACRCPPPRWRWALPGLPSAGAGVPRSWTRPNPSRHRHSRRGATMVGVSDVSQVINNQAASRFELQADGGLAELTYRRNGKRLVLMHTEVPVELEGRGLCGILVSAAVYHTGCDCTYVVPLWSIYC